MGQSIGCISGSFNQQWVPQYCKTVWDILDQPSSNDKVIQGAYIIYLYADRWQWFTGREENYHSHPLRLYSSSCSPIHLCCLGHPFSLESKLELVFPCKERSPEPQLPDCEFVSLIWGLSSGQFFGTHAVGQCAYGTWGWISVSSWRCQMLSYF